jgi:hypothetical protein
VIISLHLHLYSRKVYRQSFHISSLSIVILFNDFILLNWLNSYSQFSLEEHWTVSRLLLLKSNVAEKILAHITFPDSIEYIGSIVFEKQNLCIKNYALPGPVTHICNLNYSGGRDQEDLVLKPTQTNGSWDSILKTPNRKQSWRNGLSSRVPA